MYEQNRQPLPEGDASVVFAEQLEGMKQNAQQQPGDVTPESVLRWANQANQPLLASMCRRLLLPGSEIVGLSNLRQLAELAADGQACLLCMNHQSNLDVPTLHALLEDAGEADLFNQIVWVAGRKLEEDAGLTSMLVQCIHRVIVTPVSWFAEHHSEQQIHLARTINLAADRAIAELRNQGWAFGVFPSGTRARPNDQQTKHAIEQTDSFLKLFDHLLLGRIEGCTLPVTHDRNFTHETPKLNRVTYTFGKVVSTERWRREAADRFPQLDQKSASARAIEEDIAALKSIPTRP